MASERNNGILIGGKRPEYVHSAQGQIIRGASSGFPPWSSSGWSTWFR